MGERLRSRDARFNSNKCYTIFFDDGNDDSRTTNSLKAAKMKIARSPSKKRESPKTKSRKSTTVVGVQDVRMETVQTTDALPVGNELANEPAENSPSFMENVALFNNERQNDDGLTALLETERADEACDAGLFAKRSDNGGGGEKYAEENKIEHVVVSDDEDDDNDQDNEEEEETKSESLRSKNNNKRKFSASSEFDSLQVVENKVYLGEEEEVKKMKLSSAKEQMFEVFQPWALKTYGDQAKTKTITQRKKNRILKALDGKEQNNPDSSKFRFWVKSKGFTIHRPQSSCNNSTRIEAWTTRGTVPLAETTLSERGIAGGTGCEVSATATTQVLDTQKDHIDLYVASTSKDFGERVYRKVAVVEEFFDIIYNVHVEQGGRNGRHAGQKRTYRIITETYAFLPREAVTKFLGSCPTCKRNQRPFSPSRFDETFTETSSEYEALNYSSQNESSLDSTQLRPIGSVRRKAEGKASPLVTNSYTEIMDPVANETKCDMKVVEKNQSFLKSDKTWREPVESSKFDEDMQTKCDRNLGLERNFIASVFSENFKISNLLKTQSTGLNNPGLKSSCNKTKHAYLSYDWLDHKARISERSHCQYVHQLYDLTKKLSSVKSEPNLDNISRPVLSKENLDSSIDLTINQPSSININIGNSYGIDTLPQSSSGPPSCEPVDDLYFNSLDVSINMSNSSNELKILYKTTPPKKRYNLCKDKQLTSHSSLNAFCDDIPMEGEECAINLTKQFRNDSDKTRSTSATVLPAVELSSKSEPFRVDLDKVKPITSTYLRMTRSFGLTDEDALSIDDLETMPTPAVEPPLPETNPEEAYAGLMKDADKLKLMLLAWNYQNSNAIRNGSEAPDLGVVGGLWAQYQNALALNAKQPSVSPVNRTDQSSPIENQDETNSSGQKDEDDGSEDDSDDKLDQNAHDPERLKAFNMFVRLFVDENLDRMIPISKQPKEKIQAIIDSCARQFPEFCERSRKRIRTYLKSCRRNKKAREGWDNASRPTPAHLTSVQAEQILAIACENESLNAKRMRIGLDPISQSLPLPGNSTSSTDAVAPSITYPGFRSTPSTTVSTMDVDLAQPSTTVQTIPSARSSPISLTTNPQTNADPKTSTATVNAVVTSQVASPLYRPADFASPSSTSSPYSTSARPAPTYPTFFPTSNSTNVTPTDLSMKQHTQTTLQTPVQSLPSLSTSTAATSVTTTGRPPLLSHKLNPNEISAVRQLVTGYRESAAFLLRSADELEQLLLQQQ